MNKKRFSKSALSEWAFERRAWLQRVWKFDPGNGWAQVEGRGEEINRAYGEYAGLQALIDSFDLGA